MKRWTVTNPEGTQTWPVNPDEQDLHTLGLLELLTVGETINDENGFTWERIA